MKLSLKEDWWRADLKLSCWAGYQSRRGPYGARDNLDPSDGSIEVIFAPEGRGPEPLTERENELISWLEQNEGDVSQAVKDALLRWCAPDPHERGNNFDFVDAFPVALSEQDLKQKIGLYAINVHQLDVDGIPYLGYEFGCVWEEDYGLGVLMHGTSEVAIGRADTAILLWIAEAHARTRV